MENSVNLGKVDLESRKSEEIRRVSNHVPSTINPDTLFTFTTQLEFLLKYLKNRMISPRYCEEDVRYLYIKGIKYIAYPMKCFCDINMRKLNYHMEWYGDYGIAFDKDWGMKHNIQPVYYLNENSDLRKDISKVFRAVIKEEERGSKTHEMLKNYLLHELMYYKPYQGKIRNRKNNGVLRKCFTDECEWRYIPDVSSMNLQQAIPESVSHEDGFIQLYSDAMDLNKDVSLCFKYSDIKHIIVQTLDEYRILSDAVESWGVEDKAEILSKVIVWKDKKEDF